MNTLKKFFFEKNKRSRAFMRVSKTPIIQKENLCRIKQAPLQSEFLLLIIIPCHSLVQATCLNLSCLLLSLPIYPYFLQSRMPLFPLSCLSPTLPVKALLKSHILCTMFARRTLTLLGIPDIWIMLYIVFTWHLTHMPPAA